MSKSKCYISGKIGELPVETYTAHFRRAEIAVGIMGYEPVNPVEIHQHCEMHEDWLAYMRCDLIAMLKDCTAVYALSNWKQSRGAQIEIGIALLLGIKVIYENAETEANNSQFTFYKHIPA